MKGIFIPLAVFVLCMAGCDIRQREEVLQQREAALNEKEQQLLVKEKTLQVKEEALLRREQRLDSTLKTDTTHLVNPALVGRWEVKMVATETTCPGSAVGDTKTETWDFAYQGNIIVVKAIVSEKLVRVYTGFYTGNTIELVEEVTNSQVTSKMVIRLRIVDDTHMEGQREIVRQGDCRVLYALQLQKR